MAHTVAITNQKGGVGKTTTAVNLAAAIAVTERRTLLVDADPQGNTTSGVGIAKLELQLSLYDALVENHPVQDVILSVPGLPYLSLLPATQDLVGAELQLVERPFRESALRRVLEPIERNYDYIILDCPPSLGLLTLNVLAAVDALIIPIQCEYYGLEGISQLLNTVRLVQQNINPGLAIGGVLLTMYDSRLNLCRQVAEDATEYFGSKVFGTPIPRNVRLAEAPSFGKPILLYDVQSVGAKSYLAVAQELLRRVEGADAVVMPVVPSPAAERPASGEPQRSAEAGLTEPPGAGDQVAAAESTESEFADSQSAESQLAAPAESQVLEPDPVESHGANPEPAERKVAELDGSQGGIAEPQIADPRGDHESPASRPGESESVASSESPQHDRSSEFDESAASRPPSQHLPEVIT